MSLSPATFYDDNGVVRLQGQLDGGGGGPLVGCLLGNSANVDVHAAATVGLTWDTVYDGLQNFTPLPGLPAGLGLTVDLTGVSPAIAPTVTGTWALGVQVALVDGADITFKAYVTIAQSVAGILLGPTVANDAILLAGAAMDCVSQGSPGGDFGVSCTTTAAATANPYRLFVLYSIVRLA